MSQPKTWLHFLTDEQGRCYQYQNGQAVATAQAAFLPVGPDGWIDKTIKWQRDSNYHQLFRTFTNPFKHVKEGAFIVRDRLYKKGTEDKLYHVIHKLDKSFGGGWKHKYFYKGQIDLSKVNDTDTSVGVNILEGGLSKFVKANENTEYELDIDVADAVDIKHDGITLKQKATYLISDGSAPEIGRATIAMQLIGNESVSSINAVSQERVKTGNSAGALFNADTRFLTTGTEDTAITINWDFNVTLDLVGVSPINPTSVFLQLIVLENGSSTNNINIQQIPFTDPVQLYNHKHHMVGTYTATIPANRQCLLYMTSNQGATNDFTFYTYDNDGSFSIDYTYRHRTTFIKGLRPMYVAQKLLDKMTGGGYQLISNYISSEWNNLLITSGDAIRGIAGAKLKTSWRALYDSYNVPCNLSSGIRDQVMYVEKKAGAYQSNVQLDLGAVTNMVVNIAQDFMYNLIKIGYPNTDTEVVNGRDEFNVTVTYTSVATKPKTFDLISKYRASMYEIEDLRINLDGKTTTDATNDNTVFFIHAETNATTGGAGEPATYYKLLRNTYTSLTGLISPSSAYNLELHPELCLKRHGDYIHGAFYWLASTDLTRETSDKNDRVVAIKSGQTYIGNKTIQIATLDAPLFIPLTFQVEGPMPDETITILEAGPNGTFTWTYGDDRFYGFPLETGIQPVDRPAQESTLLCTPATDITKLVVISR